MNHLSIFFSPEKKFIRSLKNILGFFPGNTELYKQAFRHKSAAIELSNGFKNNNERLEYLGDAILGAIVAELLFRKFPYKDEGFLTQMRSKIVNRENLNRLGKKIGLDALIEKNMEDRDRSRSMTGDAFESLVGAIYLDKGYNKTQDFILNRIIRNHVDIDELEAAEMNFKSKLLEWSQKEKKLVVFEVAEEIPDKRNRLLKIRVLLDNEEISSGIDFSKKRAEQLAAEEACKKLGI